MHAISEDLKRLNGKLESAQLYVDQKINKREHGKKSQVNESDAAPSPHGERDVRGGWERSRIAPIRTN